MLLNTPAVFFAASKLQSGAKLCLWQKWWWVADSEGTGNKSHWVLPLKLVFESSAWNELLSSMCVKSRWLIGRYWSSGKNCLELPFPRLLSEEALVILYGIELLGRWDKLIAGYDFVQAKSSVNGKQQSSNRDSMFYRSGSWGFPPGNAQWIKTEE